MKLVKSASGKGRRPVVGVKVKIDGLILEDDFTLAERKHMMYPVLIGRNILKAGNFLIDPKNVDQLKKCIEKFITMSNSDLQNMRKRSRELVLQRYSDDVVIRKYKEIYSGI